MKVRISSMIIAGLVILSVLISLIPIAVISPVLASDGEIHQVPLSLHYPDSNKDWYLYQLQGYSNNNCGPASAAMVINYLKGKNLKTAYDSFVDSSIPNVHCTARGYYCQSYLQAHGQTEAIYSNGYYNSDWSEPGARDYQIQNALSLEGIDSHIIYATDYADSTEYLQEIMYAIESRKLVIACVDPSEYITGSSVNSHWTVVFGYDDTNIYLNDPGWIRFADSDPMYAVSKTDFKDALWNAQ